jgi:hypothetical protein
VVEIAVSHTWYRSGRPLIVQPFAT